MRRIVALFVLSLAPTLAFAVPAQAVQSNAQSESQNNGNPVDDAQELPERPTTTRSTTTENRARRPTRASSKPATRTQSFLPGMFR